MYLEKGKGRKGQVQLQAAGHDHTAVLRRSYYRIHICRISRSTVFTFCAEVEHPEGRSTKFRVPIYWFHGLSTESQLNTVNWNILQTDGGKLRCGPDKAPFLP